MQHLLPNTAVRRLLGAPVLKGNGMKNMMITTLALTLAAAFAPALSAAEYTQAPKDFNELVKKAKAEGELTVIACPRDWLNYGIIFQNFTKKYGIKINELNPEGSSAEEIEAIKANKGSKARQAPDVVDVSFSFGPEMKDTKLMAPYKVQTWGTIPNEIKDADGFWFGGYYGTLVFEVNVDVIKNPPKDWNDLLKPEFKGKFALAGDPRLSGQAFLSVAAAGLANGGDKEFKDMMPALQFFKKLNEAGNLVPLIAVPGTVASGETPITVRWDYLALSNRDKCNGNPTIGSFIPASGQIAGVYLQGISAYAPHPNAARLYEEYLFSDEGQLIWLSGYGHPARFDDLMAHKKISKELLAKLPVAPKGTKVYFPSLAQQEVIKKACAEQWDKIVNVDIRKQ
jgi:putative spermidine/putrescine transport system substrate-binding protein